MASRGIRPVCIYEPQLAEEQIDIDLKVSLSNPLDIRDNLSFQILMPGSDPILYPTSRSTVNVTSMASLGQYFFPGALLLRLLPI